MSLRIGIIHNQEEKSIQVLQRLRKLLAEKDDLEIVDRNPELVITIGGDGTLLSAFHRYNHRLDEVRFLGVHTGHLGFYTDWRDYELTELVNSLSAEQGKSVSYPLLDVVLTTNEGEQKHFLALSVFEETGWRSLLRPVRLLIIRVLAEQWFILASTRCNWRRLLH
jgi:NAD+ kinase